MRSLTIRAALAASLLLAACAPQGLSGPGAGDQEAGGGAVLLVRTARHLDVALATAAGMLRGDYRGVRFEAAHVIACGDAVPTLLDRAAAVATAAEAGVVVTVCALTLERKQIDPSALPPHTTVVDNGLVEALRLQRKGYQSVEL